MKFSDFVIPGSIEEAQAILKDLGDAAVPVAGGTAFQYIADRPGITAVDISRLDLAGIERNGDAFHVGATTTLSEVVEYRQDGWILGRVATRIPTHQIRNISTVGGNIARLFPWSELPLVFLVLGATVVTRADGETGIPAETFFKSQPRDVLGGGTLITRVEVPAVGVNEGFGYRKESVTNSAFSLMTAAAFIAVEDGKLKTVRVAAGSAIPKPARIHAVEELLTGQPADESILAEAAAKGTEGVSWKGNEGMSNEFAAHLARVVTLDALAGALKEAQGNG